MVSAPLNFPFFESQECGAKLPYFTYVNVCKYSVTVCVSGEGETVAV